MGLTSWRHRQFPYCPDVRRLGGIRAVLLAALLSTLRATAPVQTYDHCQEAANGITAALMECDRVEDHLLDAELNDPYKTLMVTLSEPRKTLLRQAQRDWLAFRSSAEAGGSDAFLVADSCALGLMRARIDVLKQAMIEAGAPMRADRSGYPCLG